MSKATSDSSTGVSVVARIQPETGILVGATGHYVKAFADLRRVFVDEDALSALLADSPTAISYEVYEYRRSEGDGDVVFGTSILHPGLVGREFNMTRGHLHRKADRAELYYCLAGTGALLLQGPDHVAWAEKLVPGVAVYVPPNTQHRTVNVGEVSLVTLFSYASDAGQDYAVVERNGGMATLVVHDGSGGWRTERNPRFRPSGRDPR